MNQSRPAALFFYLAAWLFFFPLACGGQTQDQSAEQPPTEVAPAPAGVRETGLEIPDDVRPAPPDTEYALLQATAAAPRVVRVLSELGEERLVMRPTGVLAVAPRSQTAATGEPFKAASQEEIIATLAEDGLGDYKIVRAGYYLFAYDCSEAYYLHTRSILESMLRGVVRQLAEWGLEPKRPEVPLVVVITPSRTAFDAIEKMPAGVAAYYNGISNRVILYEDERLFEAAPEYALKQGSYVVAHEAIHQLLANTGIQRRLSAWPAWVSEGVPEYFCPLKVNSSLSKRGKDELPVRTVKWSEAGMVNDIRMHDLLRTPGQRGEVIRQVVSAPGLTAHGYSVAWGLVHYLAERRPDQFAAYLKDVRQKRPLEKPVGGDSHAPDPLFVKHFGDDFASIEQAVQKHLTGRRMQKAYSDPFVNQTHYVVSVTFKQGRVFYTKAGVILSPAAAREWKDKWRKSLKSQGISAHFVIKECRTAKEAAFHLRKIAS